MGLVIKYAGTVRKGFALIFGILLSGIVQSTLDENKTLSKEEVAGGVLAAVSLWMHATNPYVAPSTTTGKKTIHKEVESSKAATTTASNGASKTGRTGRKSRKED